MTSPERQERILTLDTQRGRVSVAELWGYFDISAATARRDLDALEGQGKLQRVHGGAIPARQALPELPILLRSTEQAAEQKLELPRQQQDCSREAKRFSWAAAAPCWHWQIHSKDTLR